MTHFRDINTKNDRDKIFKIARVIKDTNKDVSEGKCVRNDKENLTLSNKAKLSV